MQYIIERMFWSRGIGDRLVTAVVRLPLLTPEPWLAVAQAPATEMCGNKAGLCSAYSSFTLKFYIFPVDAAVALLRDNAGGVAHKAAMAKGSRRAMNRFKETW